VVTTPADLTVDVTLPYYGDVGLMKQAVRSVLDQRYEHWRLLVVDDGYPDPEPARWFAGIADPRVTYLRNETNLGANRNYRRCLELATAPVLVLMGADDVMLPDHLLVVSEVYADHPDATVVHTGVQVINEKGKVVRPLGDRLKTFYAPSGPRTTVLAGQEMAVSLLRGNWTYFPSLAWRREAIDAIGFRPGLDVVQDLALLLDLAAAGGTLVFDPRLTFQYRRHTDQDSTVRALDGRRFDEERQFFAQEARGLADRGWTRAARVSRWHLSSRLNALSLLPRAVRTTGWGAAARLGRHVVR
jgi:glycosyltransferase involved in cell wall biosynthesis